MERKEKVFQGSPNQNQITPKTKVKFESPRASRPPEHTQTPHAGLPNKNRPSSVGPHGPRRRRVDPRAARGEMGDLPPASHLLFLFDSPSSFSSLSLGPHTAPSRRRGARTRGPTTSAATVSASPRSCVRGAARGRGDRPPPSRRRPVRRTARRRPVSSFSGGGVSPPTPAHVKF